MGIWVKICGIQEEEALLAAAAARADAVGVVFAVSRRQVSPETASRLLAQAPPGVEKVGVFADHAASRVEEMAERAGLDAVQLHGKEGPGCCRVLARRYRVIKTIPVGARGPRLEAADYRHADCLLLDSAGTRGSGGHGRPFPWQWARGWWPAPVVVAGGLEPGNVAPALELLRPRGVDVSSGVERAGVKDPRLIQEFVTAVRRWEHANFGTAR